MNRFFEELKFAFKRSNNGLYRVMLINIAIYLFLTIFDVVAYLSGETLQVFFLNVMSFISVPSEPELVLYKPWTLFTYMFVHKDFFHILGNMLFLYWFGILIMEYLNSKRFVNIYILGGLAGAVFFLVFYNVLPPFVGMRAILFGASAGVSAIVVAAATLLPNHSFFLFLIGPVKIKYIALFFIVLRSFLGLKGGNPGGELAHLGGALIGFVYIRQLQSGRDIGGWVSASIDWVANLFKSNPKIRVTHSRNKEKTYTYSSRSAKSAGSSNHATINQDEIDAILDKISESGYESLSKEEKQKLFNASKK